MKQSINKIFTSIVFAVFVFFIGNVNVYAANNPVYWDRSGAPISSLDVSKIVFEDISQPGAHTFTSWDSKQDLSASVNPNTVTSYRIKEGSYYTLYVQFDGTLYWNANSSSLFQGFDRLTAIEGLQYVNTSNVTNMSNMFYGDEALTTLNLSSFNTSNVTNMSGMFEGTSALTSLNVSSFNTSNVTDMSEMFKGVSSLSVIDLSNFTTNNVTDMSSMFEDVSSITYLNIRYWQTPNVTDMNSMFKGMSSLTNLKINNMTTDNVTNMSSMFEGVSSLQTLALASFNTSNVTNMSNMFNGMSSLTTLTMTNFNTSNVTNMSGMFKGVSSLQGLDIDSFRTPNVTNMSEMFYNMNALTQINLSNFNTANVTNMSGMFYNCNSLSTLNLSSFNTSSVTNMSYMFSKLSVSSLDVSTLDVSHVTNMSYMFEGMTNITVLELSTFDTSRVTNISSMFANCTSIQRIWVSYLWNIGSTATGTNVFTGDTNLAVDNGTVYDPTRVGKGYAKIDTYNSPGYLNFHWSISSDVYEITFTKDDQIIDALQNIFEHNQHITLTCTHGSISHTYDDTYYYVIYNGVRVRRFKVVRPILGITLSNAGQTLTLIKGRTHQLSASVWPSNTTYDKAITWTSSDPTKATVTQTGLVTGIAPGTVTITASTVNVRNDSHSATVTYEVIVPIYSFTADSYVEKVPIETTPIDYTITPDDVTENTDITWTSADTSIVQVDPNTGVLTGVTPGTTTVTGVIPNGRYVDSNWDLHYGATVTVTVKVLIPIDNYRIAEAQHTPEELHETIYVGDPVDYQKQLTSIYTPAPGVFEVDGTLQWTSSDTDVATVTQNGLVTGVDNGTARITSTVKKYPYHTDYIFVDVRVLANGLSFSNHAANVRKDLEIGNSTLSNTFTYDPIISPSNSYYRTITYASSDPTVASVNPTTGQVTALSAGTTTITATLANGKNTTIQETRDIRVPVPITGFDVTESSVDLYVGHSTQYEATLTPVLNPSTGYEVDDTIEWDSSNETAATVDEYGVVTGLDNGTTTISSRLTHYGQQYTDSTTVNVHVLTSSFTIDNQGNETLELEEGQTFTYETTILPQNSAYKNVVWTSSDSNIASVNQSTGVVTANSPGTVTITARLANGINPDIVLTRTVKVLIPIRQFSLQEKSVDLYVGDSSANHTTLTPVYSPNPYEVDGTLEWTTTDDTVATVTQGGLVTGLKDGTATISARVIHYGQTFIASTTVHVHVLTDSVTITDPATSGLLQIEEGDTFTYETEILPVPSSYRNIVWTSSNDNVVSINPSTGEVHALSPGTVTITGRLANGIRPDIVLTRQIQVLIPIRQFSLQEQSVDLYVGDSTADHTTLTPVYSPDPYEVDGTLEWTTTDNTVATVTQGGVVTGVKDGTATISARVTHYGQTFIASTTVHVHVLTDSVTITDPATSGLLQMEEGESFTYETEILPNPSSYRNIVWSSSNDNIVSIDSSTGEVEALSPGTVTITGRLANGIRPDIVVTRQIQVLIPIRQFELTHGPYDLYIGETGTDTTTIVPIYTPTTYEVPGTLEWTTSDNTVATVTQGGVVTGLKDGTATISARVTHYGQTFISSVQVNVHVLTDSVTITNPSTTGTYYMEEGDTFTYQAEFSPSGASYRNIVWQSSDGTIASVTPSGTVTANSPGDVTITGTLSNGIRPDITITRTIHVKVPIRQFRLTAGPYNLYIGDASLDHTTITPILTPSSGYEVDDTIIWTSSNNNVVRVAADGTITAYGNGTATIYARLDHYGTTYENTNSVHKDSVTVNVTTLTSTFTIDDPAAQEPGEKYQMEIGESKTIDKTIIPETSSYKNIVWTSSNSTIASVADGVITARASGDATITATLANGAHPDIVISRDVHVKMPITNFELTDGTYNLYVGDASLDHTTIVPIYTPSNYEVSGTLEWTTSNSNVATVNNGVVTGVGTGTATITARVTHYGQQFIDSVDVHVTRLTDSFVITDPPAQAQGEKYQMEIGETKTVVKTITPPESDYKSIVWTSSNSNIASVADGVITAVSAGDATITATLANGAHPNIVITRDIHVKRPITNFELTDGTYNLYVGDSNANHTTIVPIYTPSNYEVDGTLEWTTSNSNVATVNNGVVTGVGAGTATITARVTHYGQTFIDSVDVHVTVLASSLDISNQLANVEKQIEEGETFTYTTTIAPQESSYTTVTWATSNSTIVSIADNHDGTATITANSPGDVTITASLVNGIGQPLTTSRSVHVKTPIRAVNIIEDSAILYLQDNNSNTATLHTAFTPSTGYEVSDDLTWSSSNSNIVDVDEYGVITAVGKGTATITAAVTHYGQAVKDTASVEVKVLAESVTITNQPAGEPYLSIEDGESFTFQTSVLPANSNYTTVTWSTSDSTIVSIVDNGNGTATITGGLEGDAVITATVANPVGGNVLTSRTVHVKTPIYQLDVPSTHTLYLGDQSLESYTIPVEFDPPDYEVNDSLVWESEDEDVVTVDENGTITAVSTGTGFVVVSLEDYPDVYEVIQVTVKQLAQNINITNQPANQTLELEVGDTFTYQKTVTPSNAEDKTVRWTTSNSRVVSVNRNTGEITAKAAGTVTITATVTNNPSQPITATRTVKVLKPIQAFDIHENDVTLYVGNSTVDHATLTPIFTPSDAEVRKNITWATANSNIVTVDNGVVTAVGPAGDVDVTGTVTYYPQFADTTHVHVKVLASSINIQNQLANETLELEVGDTFTYQKTISPSNSSYTTVTWSSSDGNVVSVDSSTGTITAESAGTATITGTIVNGYGPDITVTRTVKVLRQITGFDVNQSTATLYVGDSSANHTTLTTSFSSPVQNELPEVDMDITWTSSDPSRIAIVDNDDGTATITATAATLTDPVTPVTINATVTNYPQFSDTVTVTSYVLASSIDITNQNENPKEMEVGDTFVYQTSILPANSSYTNISWSSSNSTIVSINPNTKTITAVSAGTATITATLHNGLGPDLSVSKNVKVLRPITNFYVRETSETLYVGDATADNITLTPVFASSDPNELPEVDMGITWTSSSPTVATVDSSGHVVAGNIDGTTTITATVTNYPQFSDTMTINTKVLTTSFSITKPTETPSPKILEVGQTFEFETEILPSNSSYKNISWQSSNPTIVSITPGQDGKATITAVTAGTVTITATLPNGNQPDRIVTRTVKVPRPITDFYVTETDETLYVGDATADNITLTPVFGSSDPNLPPEVDMGITWSSSSPTVATVDSSGHVVAGNIEGTTTITATVTNYPQYRDTIIIRTKVLATDFSITKPTSTPSPKTMEVGETYEFETSILPANSSYKTITWQSSNPTIVSIEGGQDGKATATAVSAGTVTITATLPNGNQPDRTVTRTIEVLRPITGFDVEESSETLYVGDATKDNITLTPVFSPKAPNDPEVDMGITWTSSSPTVATVDANGHVVAGNIEGRTTITATVTNYPSFHDEVIIDTKVLTSSFTITSQTANTIKEMEVGDTHQYLYTILPTNSSYKTITWTSSNPTIVSVNTNSGYIEALSPGTVTITATLQNGLGQTKTETRTVKVLRPITAFNIVESSETLYSGNASVDNITLTPVFASNDPNELPEVNMDITWTSSDTSVATVDANGKVTAKSKEGTATITGTVTNYPSFHDSVTIDVYVLAQSLDITNQLISENPKILEVGDTFTYETEILPANSSYTTLAWTTSNSNMVSITDNADGTATISADSPGTVTITATLTNGYGNPLSVSRTVKVLRPITAFNIVESSETLYSGNASVDNITLTPVFASNDPSLLPEVNMDITWTSSDTSVATVDANGKVTAKSKEGTTTITGTVTNYPSFHDSVTVDVYVLAQSLTITNQNENPKIMEEGQTFTYQTEITPSNSSYTTITWESSNSTVVSVTNNNNGTATISADSPGTVTITATLTNGYGNALSVTKNVKVLRKITGFDVTQSNATLYVGDASSDHTTLTTTFSSPIPNELPEVDMDITWTSSDPTRVTVTKNNDGTATITAIAATITDPAPTPVTITATVTNYPQFSDTVDVTSFVLASSFEITNYQEGENPMELEVGNSITYQTRILPATSSYTNIVWSTSDSTKVSIVDNGDGTATITGVAATGNTPVTITATLANGNQQAKVVTRTIKVPRPIQAFDVVQASSNLYIGDASTDHTTLTTTFTSPVQNELPEVDMDITWQTSDPTKVTVTKNNDGTATITAKAATLTNPVTPVKITATVTNYPQFSDTVTVYSYVLTQSFELTNQPEDDCIDVNQEFQYTYDIQPGNSSYKNIVWASSVPTVANIDQTGKLTSYVPGDTVITATLSNGLGPDFVETRNIHVNVPITFFDVTESSADLYIGDSNRNHATLTPSITPSSGYEVDDTIIWTSSNQSVVTVDELGTIRAVGNGTATIYARLDHYGTTYDNTAPAYKDSISVTVTTLTSNFDITNQLAGQTLKLDPGQEFQYEYELLPETSSYQNIVWSTSNSRIASVSQTGKVTANEPGTVTITAHLDNGIREAYNIQRTVLVPIQLTGFSLSQDITDIYTNDPDELLDHAHLTPSFTPSDSQVDRDIEWTSSDESIATVEDVNGVGVVTGVNGGTATITGRVIHYGNDPRFTDSKTVTVHIMATDYDITNQESEDTLEIEVGEDFEYETEITPSNSSYTTVSWASSDSNIVSVDQDGVITGVYPGTATITTTLQNGLNTTISTSRTVKVLRPIDTFTITTPDTTLYYGNSNVNSVDLATAFTSPIPNQLPEVDMTVTWSSSNENVATVDSTGHVVAGSTAGTATITGTVRDYPSKTDSITITTKVLATSIDITTQDAEENPMELEVGDTFDYETTILPENSSYTTVTWNSSNTSAVSIVDNLDGISTITAEAAGTSTITATLTNGYGPALTVTRNVKVLRPIATFDITEGTSTLYYGNNDYNHATLHTVFTSPVPNELPEVDMGITWTSSNDNVVSVNNGVITAVGKGTATITGTVTNYPDFHDSVTVTVEMLATSIDITTQDVEENPMELEVGDTFDYETEISPNNSSYTTVTWNSSNASAVTIVDNQDGTATITAVAPGNSTITATVTNPVGQPVTVTRNVKVLIPIQSISLSPSTKTLYIVDPVNDHATLTPVYNPSEAEVDKSVTWSSSDNNVVTVDNGVITARNKGTATITATSVHYPEMTATASITVDVLATGITISNQDSETTMDLRVGQEFTYETSVSPNNSSFTNIVWSSSNTSAIQIDQTGKITAIAPGTSTITATINNAVGEPITETRTVRVPVPITAFNITETDINLTENVEGQNTATIHTEFTPQTGYQESDTITWESSDEDVATVVDGVVTAVDGGDATITATLPNGLSDTVDVHVAVVIEQFILETPTEINVELGGTYEARTSYSPLNTTESTTVTWTSDNQSVATVNDGVISGNLIGDATITATLGSRQVTIDVHVIIGITSFTLNEDELELSRNDTFLLETTITPSNTTESKVVSWTSSEPTKVSITDNEDGTATVTALAAGESTITSSLANGRHAECVVTVTTAIDSFTVSPASAALETNTENNQVELSYEILPSDAQEDKTVTWTSSNSSIASVEDGVVTAVGNGTATITAHLPNGMTATSTITVTTPMQSFTVTNGTYKEMTISQTHTIETEIEPSNTSDSKVITWSSSIPTVASVVDGVVTANNYGTTTITGSLPNGMSISVSIKVIKPISSFIISQDTLYLYYGDSERNHATLTTTILPDDTDQSKEVSWSSNKTSVATVDQNGNVTAVNKGNATITASLQNGMTAECEVTVYKPVTQFVINGDSTINLNKGQNTTLTTTITPSDTTDSKTVTWTSTQTGVATVNASGKVTAVGGGTTTITARLSNGMTATKTVVVSVPITKFSLGSPSIDLLPGENRELKVTILPKDTTESTTITWSTTNSSVATINNGTITAHNLGEATITATLPSGRKATVDVTVTLTPRTRMRGDIDDDGDVDLNDAVAGLRIIYKYDSLKDGDLDAGDINNSGAIDLNDIVSILRYIYHYDDVL